MTLNLTPQETALVRRALEEFVADLASLREYGEDVESPADAERLLVKLDNAEVPF